MKMNVEACNRPNVRLWFKNLTDRINQIQTFYVFSQNVFSQHTLLEHSPYFRPSAREKLPDGSDSAPSILFTGYLGFLVRGSSGQNVKLTIHLYLVSF